MWNNVKKNFKKKPASVALVPGSISQQASNSFKTFLAEHCWVVSGHNSTAWMGYLWVSAQHGWLIRWHYCRTWIGNNYQPPAQDESVIRDHFRTMDGFKVGTRTASMGYQWVNYPTWMDFWWDASGESLECMGACPNDTPWTVPESLSWSTIKFQWNNHQVIPWQSINKFNRVAQCRDLRYKR